MLRLKNVHDLKALCLVLIQQPLMMRKTISLVRDLIQVSIYQLSLPLQTLQSLVCRIWMEVQERISITLAHRFTLVNRMLNVLAVCVTLILMRVKALLNVVSKMKATIHSCKQFLKTAIRRVMLLSAIFSIVVLLQTVDMKLLVVI